MPLFLACYFPAEEPVFIPVDISGILFVKSLLSTIEEELHKIDRFKGIKANDLHLFKADSGVPLKPNDTRRMRALQWLHQPANGSELDEDEYLDVLFPNGNVQGMVDIIIADAEVLEMLEGLGDPDNEYLRKIMKALDKRVKCESSPSPSEFVNNPNKQSEAFRGAKPPIYMDRPGGAPAVIYQPSLATLQHRLEHPETITVSSTDVEHAAEFFRCAAAFYKDESERQKAIKTILDGALGATGNWQLSLGWADSIKPVGSWWNEHFLLLVLELKNTLGLHGDALLQAAFDYFKIVSREKYKEFRQYCNFPVVLIGITANRLEIGVAVCVGPIYVTRLLTLDLSLDFLASNSIVRLARVFHALSSCRDELQIYYEGVRNKISRRLSCLYPNPTPIDPSTELPQLIYKQFLSPAGQPISNIVELANKTSALYVAILTATNHEVVVKFTARYSEEAHRLLAEAQLAPALHYCGRVVGDLFMIVMDRVDGTSIWQLKQDKTPIPSVVPTKVEEAVRILHDNNIVHGDLRDPNILYSASSNSVMLVDFDWPGKHGVCRYPATLNRSANWAQGVGPYETMLKEHDSWQVKRLQGLCP
ncbi:hypothetical protein BD410DRAFT_821803 [Rickenella mellea]|uniref:non-specific serine/threonine protein kinase n=1 Tax=Rickenella mellea TaxID=50990 RepID=A0A4Y7PZJ8_9AGAM|nr:hypothetical protein BD410DRAFT_821803 [Rickenella mellea]